MKIYRSEDMTDEEYEQAQNYCRMQQRCDELAGQLFAAETQVKQLEWEVNFYKTLWERTIAPIFQNV